jgi:hypothetical protein
MTPKSKADHLLIKFKMSESKDGYNDVRDIHAAIRCTIIAVDEVLKVVTTLDDSFWQKDTLEFWQEVKNEIEKI